MCMTAVLSGLSLLTYAQLPSKKPLDHSVYDSWQSIGSKSISNNGQWIAYTITPQEGDASLVIYNSRTQQQLTVPRGYNAVITEDNHYVVFLIKAPFADIRQAKIRKKKVADMPKDSLGIITLGNNKIEKIPSVRSFSTPEKAGGLVAYLAEKPKADTASGHLIIRQLDKKLQDTIRNVQNYLFSKPGNRLLAEVIADKKDSLSTGAMLLWDVTTRKTDTLSLGTADRKQLAFDEKGEQAAWYSSRDSAKALQQFYQLCYYRMGQDTATIAAARNTSGIPSGWSVNPNGKVWFSRNGERLFFGTAPIQPPKDTSIIDFEVAKVDIWNYKDDYLQPMQLKNLDKELKRSYQALYYPASGRVLQLADKDMENISIADEGNCPYAMGYTDKGQRLPMQWTGHSLKTIYTVNLENGNRRMVQPDLDSLSHISPSGRFIAWYNLKEKQWYTYENETNTTRNITASIPASMAEEDDDHPDMPGPYGTGGWMINDEFIFIYDRYDIWKVDPTGKIAPQMLTGGTGRQQQLRFRTLKLTREERFFKTNQPMLLETYSEITKENGFYTVNSTKKSLPQKVVFGPYTYGDPVKADEADNLIFTKASYVLSPDLYTGTSPDKAVQVSHINPQQKEYNWGTVELFKWTAYNGKPAEGILYKPEDFDSTKKYPVLLYFYEKLTDGLYSYQPPSPTPSRLNIPFFVSRGYLVLVPDVTYEPGHPGKGAYDYIVSGARALARHPWADSTNMGIQGQSWGGYQVAYLVTKTKLFKAAWAGAPVANMTSAYGGIRWESGMNRQFQYERSQSRIGATLWEKPELYIENSPLFYLPDVTTPLAIMSNDADGAVPWYQGIELFTGLRRLGKPVWLLNYNNEAHNLIQRQNRKDISRREQQFFDYFLKGAPAPEWIESGVPATEKGRNWGW
ncbi:prolyl oligopeptidase family serine peptidase [Chitinophaga sp. ysch24]|uniref:Prolyl oligopeptidase family serine peptidase n=2 Tax=Chitinophaga tropicalis TaxID=2683588 RepID=A0A7K1UBC5_9BACT|nr:prolyl oligopeptidase family serine peptidase [Chitinophaga tropicalis]